MELSKVIELLLSESPRTEAVYLAVAALGMARTAEIADFVGADRSNTGRRLESLAEDGRIVLVDDCDSEGHLGRPSRLWAIA
jgi:predicted ArsR family transcriptional regulator